MKALSIRQPWAWLICAGLKDIENRDWPTRFRGRIYVHAGKAEDREGWYHIDEFPENYDLSEAAIDQWVEAQQTMLDGRGCIIGEVDIVGCVTHADSPWFVGKYGFLLANPTLYDKPIPYKGQLGFFDPKIDPPPATPQLGGQGFEEFHD